jgi:hypothetical protein
MPRFPFFTNTRVARVATATALMATVGTSAALAVMYTPSQEGGSYGVDHCVPVQEALADIPRVSVTLTEWSVTAGPATAAAGTVGFAALNGGVEPHELVVVKGTDIPVDADGALDEAALPEGALIGEIEPFPAGLSCGIAFELSPGPYTLLCNIVEMEDGVVEAHYNLGMTTGFTVTG